MRILYTGDNEGPVLMDLDTLVANFNANDGWHYHHSEEDMRPELASRGWYEGLHENGRYLVVNLDKLQLTPTPEGWDGLYNTKPTRKEQLA